jgi:hypothetical protein
MAENASQPCADDLKKFCAGVQPGEGRLKACIKSHLAELSEGCAVRAYTVAVAGKICKNDVSTLCAGVVPGTGGLRACIKSHIAEVSDPCKDAMARTASGRKLLGKGDL